MQTCLLGGLNKNELILLNNIKTLIINILI